MIKNFFYSFAIFSLLFFSVSVLAMEPEEASGIRNRKPGKFPGVPQKEKGVTDSSSVISLQKNDDFFSHLPDETLNYVFSALTVYDLLIMSETSKRFETLIKSFYQHLKLPYPQHILAPLAIKSQGAVDFISNTRHNCALSAFGVIPCMTGVGCWISSSRMILCGILYGCGAWTTELGARLYTSYPGNNKKIFTSCEEEDLFELSYQNYLLSGKLIKEIMKKANLLLPQGISTTRPSLVLGESHFVVRKQLQSCFNYESIHDRQIFIAKPLPQNKDGSFFIKNFLDFKRVESSDD